MKEVELCSRGGRFLEEAMEAMDALDALESLELLKVLVILEAAHEKR